MQLRFLFLQMQTKRARGGFVFFPTISVLSYGGFVSMSLSAGYCSGVINATDDVPAGHSAGTAEGSSDTGVQGFSLLRAT